MCEYCGRPEIRHGKTEYFRHKRRFRNRNRNKGRFRNKNKMKQTEHQSVHVNIILKNPFKKKHGHKDHERRE